MVKISLGFSKFSDSKLLTFADNVITRVSGIAVFSKIFPDVADVTNSRDEFRVALANAQDGGKSLTAAKKQKREVLVTNLKLWASYIEDHSNNDEALILSTGFELSQKPTAGSRPQPPSGVYLLDGELSGTAMVKCNKVDNALSYESRYREAANGEWKTGPSSTRTTFGIEGITPGTVIWVQVRGFNSHGHGEWSDPATIMVR